MRTILLSATVLAVLVLAGVPAQADGPRETAQTEREKELEKRLKSLEKKIEGEGGQGAARSLSDRLVGAEVRFEEKAEPGMFADSPSIVIWEFGHNGSIAGSMIVNRSINAHRAPKSRKPNDTGTWRAEGNTVCIRWASWDDGAERCYGVQKSGRNHYLVGHGAKYRVTGLNS